MGRKQDDRIVAVLAFIVTRVVFFLIGAGGMFVFLGYAGGRAMARLFIEDWRIALGIVLISGTVCAVAGDYFFRPSDHGARGKLAEEKRNRERFLAAVRDDKQE